MPKQTGKSFLYLECPLCQGRGLDGDKDCKRCQGRGVYAWLEGDFLYWDKKIDVLHIFEEEIERLVKSLINGFLIFFGLIGVVLFIIAMYEIVQAGKYFWQVFGQHSKLMAVFAVSLLIDLYAYYRLQRESLLENEVKAKAYDTFLTEESTESLFDQFFTVEKDKRLEVSSTYTLPATKVAEDAWQLARKLNHDPSLCYNVILEGD